VFLVEGWFKDTLNDQTKIEYAIEEASIIMVDCESYSSTTECLNFVEPMILKEAIVMFADWKGWNGRNLHEKNLGEKRAFMELIERHPDIEVAADLGSFSLESQVFHVRRRLSDQASTKPLLV
jgi:O-methyltransferase